MKPRRIQRKRTKGWKMPANTIYVGRPSRWGNPFPFQKGWTNKEIVDMFQRNLSDLEKEQMKELKDKNLACWCPLDQPCHADTLLGIANG